MEAAGSDRRCEGRLSHGDQEMAMKADKHPRHHALTMAAATHLRDCGHLSPEQCDAINRDARGKLDAHKAKKKKPTARPFGSLAPMNPPMMEKDK